MSLKAGISSVSPLSEWLDSHSDKGLLLETSAYKLFTVANLNSVILSHWRNTTVSSASLIICKYPFILVDREGQNEGKVYRSST